MDEHQNQNQGNGFAAGNNSAGSSPMQGDATTWSQRADTQPGNASSDNNIQNQNTTYRWSRPEPEANTTYTSSDRRQDYSAGAGNGQSANGSSYGAGNAYNAGRSYSADGKNAYGQGGANQPADHMYQFQDAQPEKKKKKKTGLTMPKMIAGAAAFGIVAALCFAGVTALVSAVTGKNINPFSDDGAQQEPTASVSIVSGAANSPYDVSDIVDNVMPSIVAITEKSTQTNYFGQQYSTQGAGSGFIVKQDKDQILIVTNNHVVDDADEIRVQFNDGEVADAEVKGTSAVNDLAVITVDLSKLKDSTKKSIRVAALGSSDDAKVGQMVIAIGNALGYGQSVTVGYLSAKDRQVENVSGAEDKSSSQLLLQTDAAINPGNSGGALIDTSGRVIGINSSKYFYYNSQIVDGIGYAIPMSDVVPIINSLMNREVLKDDERGYLGITGRSINQSVSDAYGIPVGVYVVAMSETGAAYKGGIQQGDVITKIGEEPVTTIEQVIEIVNGTKAGTEVEISIMRNENGEYKEKKIKVTLKTKETLDGLEDETNDDKGSDSDGSSQVVPWGSGY